MNLHDSVIFTIKSLDNYFKRLIDRNAGEISNELTGMQLAIIARIGVAHENENVFQKDIEEEFNIRGSNITRILKVLEKEKYVRRVRIPDDERFKKLTLTEKSLDIYSKIEDNLFKNEEIAIKNLTAEEIAAFMNVAHKIMKNVSNY